MASCELKVPDESVRAPFAFPDESGCDMATVFPAQSELAVIETELLETAHYAARQPRIVERFTDDEPTRWTDAHRYINDLLDDWQHAR